MATISGTGSMIAKGIHRKFWETLTETNADGSALDAPDFPDKTVHVKGDFGAGGTCLIEVSNDAVTWKTGTDPQGNALSFTAEAVEAIQENARYVRPRVSAGTGVDLDVIIISRASPR